VKRSGRHERIAGTSRRFQTLLTYRKAEIICLLHQADYLLQRQLESLEDKFLAQGGFKEKLFAARLQARSHGAPARPLSPRPSTPGIPSAPRTDSAP